MSLKIMSYGLQAFSCHLNLCYKIRLRASCLVLLTWKRADQRWEAQGTTVRPVLSHVLDKSPLSEELTVPKPHAGISH